MVMQNYVPWRTHRFAYHLTKGAIPDGMQVLHSCDNPPCCNPDHLRVGTSLNNARDMVGRGRGYNQGKTACPQGHPYRGKNFRRDTDGGRRCRKCEAGRRKIIYDKTYVKTGYIHGEQSNLSKLTVDKVREIRNRVAGGEKWESVAAAFNIDRTHVWRIITKRAWSRA